MRTTRISLLRIFFSCKRWAAMRQRTKGEPGRLCLKIINVESSDMCMVFWDIEPAQLVMLVTGKAAAYIALTT